MKRDSYTDETLEARASLGEVDRQDPTGGGTFGRVPDPSRTEAPRLVADRYRLGRSIARDSTAEVFEATDDTLRRTVAVKVLHPQLAEDPEVVERFHREAIATARLVHPNIVETYDAGASGGEAYIVTELVAGRPLDRLLHDEGEVAPARAVHIASQVAAALEEAHQWGILHRDLKPASILVSDDDRVKVADLGLTPAPEPATEARAGRADPDDPTEVSPGAPPVSSASVAYRAPEQLNGEPADARTDVYALGAILYELVCGRPPFPRETDVAVALAHLSEAPLGPRQVRAGVPRPLEDAILRALEKSPADRYPSAADFQSALLSIDLSPDDALPLVVRDPTPPEGVAGPAVRFRQTERSWLWPTVMIVVVAVSLGLVGVLFATTETAQRLFNREPGMGGTEVAQEPLRIRQNVLFDPGGDGEEHNGELPRLTDGARSTTWSTHQYHGAPWGNLKPGVGVVLNLEGVGEISELTLSTPSNGWSLAVHVADRAQPTLAGWGEPVVGERNVAAGTLTLDVGGARGGAVLVWISDPGPRNQVEIGEIELA